MKSVTSEAIEKSLAKLHTLTLNTGVLTDIQQLIQSLKPGKSYKTHFLVEARGSKMIPLPASDIVFFFTDSGKVTARTFDEKSYPMDSNLDELMSKLHPGEFFRANRQYIIVKNAIKDVDWWFNQRLSINLKIPVPEKILISRTRVTEFRQWFAGE